MRNKTFGEFVEENLGYAREWLNIKAEIYRLELKRAAAKIAGNLISSILSVLLLFLFIIFGGITTAFLIAERSGSYALGFGIVTLLLLLLVILFIRLRKNLFINPLIRTMLKNSNESRKFSEESNN